MKTLAFNLLVLTVLFSITGCSSDTEIIKVHNDDGILIQEYVQRIEDAAKNGYSKTYDEEGNLIIKENYVDDMLQGEQIFYYPNGKVKETRLYENGLQIGADISYFEDGQIEQKINYIIKDGTAMMEGIMVNYYANGQVKEEVTFKDGNETGPFVEYHENGNLKAKGNYIYIENRGEVEDGLLELYNEEGLLETKMNYKNGIGRTFWTLKEGNIEVKEDLK